jgi:hypothetical protein
MSVRFSLHRADGSMQILELAGWEEWVLSHLLAAGATSHPGPRRSDQVFKLRRRGLDIATLAERREGPFAGIRGRYILRSKIDRLGTMEMAT